MFTVPCRPTRSTDCEATVESILENPQFTFGEDVRYLQDRSITKGHGDFLIIILSYIVFGSASIDLALTLSRVILIVQNCC